MPRKGIDAKFWQDNYLCVPRDSSLKFHWSVSGPINGMKCSVVIPGSNHRDRYYLCATKQAVVKDPKDSVGNVGNYHIPRCRS
ncbi:hypothetical protein AC249_AIPGENE24374 [Exaiptasia diaphana]|nr:hypothetical protein AC249_AIPGENE24374 [Exaiptasia diaphana]